MTQEQQKENGSQKEEFKRGKQRPRRDRRIIRSLGDEEGVDLKERVAAKYQEETAKCEWFLPSLLVLLQLLVCFAVLLLVAVAARAAGGSCVFLSGCFSFRVDFSFSVIQAIALCAARCVHVSWSSQ